MTPPLPKILALASTIAAALLQAAPAAAAQGAAPAGGAAVGEIVIATVGALVLTSVLLVLGIGHRTGRVGLLSAAAARAERLSGLPGWAALPSLVASVSLVTAVFGMYWDISFHIDDGRDPGPLANPAHYFILAGLFGIFAAGFFATVLPSQRPTRSAVRISDTWYAPLGGLMVCACGAFSLMGFPLDDMWHRLFGQDVTLWGPTHLMLIGGATMTLVGLAVLLVEGVRASEGREGSGRDTNWIVRARQIALAGAFLIGLSTFQAEFDFGFAQFRFVFQPILIAAAAAIALVATRLWLGRGSALGAVAFFLVVRGLLTLLIGPVLGHSVPHFPLYLVEAAIVELVALRLSVDRPLRLGAVAGALIGTVGLAAEWGWSHLWMPLPWPSTLLPEAALLGLVSGIAGGLIGAWVGARLASDRFPRQRSLRIAAVATSTVLVAIVAYALHKPVTPGLSARVALADVQAAPNRTVDATIALSPPSAADKAEWLTVTAWQGGGLVVDRLKRIGPGRYRTTQPIPVDGSWKAMVRLHRGNSLMALPIYLPSDPAIPAAEVPAAGAFTRSFVADHRILQREQKAAAPGLTTAAYGLVIAIALALLGFLAWGLHRLAATAGPPAGDSGAPPPKTLRHAGRPRVTTA